MPEKNTKARRFTSAALVARNSILNLANEAWTLAVVFVTLPIVVSKMGNDAFGLFSLAWVILGYMAILDIGVSRAATKFIPECLAKGEESTVGELSRAAIATNFLLGMAGGVLLFVLAPWLSGSLFNIPLALRHDALIAFRALAVAIPALLLQAAFRAILSAYQKFGWINLVNSFATTLQWVLACVLAAIGFHVGVVVVAAVTVRVIATVAYGLIVLTSHSHLFRVLLVPVHEVGRLLRYGGWVNVSQLMSPLLIYLDRILVASLLSVGAMTLYVIPYEIITRLRVIPNSVVATLFPSLSERSGMGNDSRLPVLYTAALRYLLVLVTPCFLVLALLGRDVLSLWVGSEYAAAGSTVLQTIAIGALLNSLACVPYAALQALGRPDIPAKFHVAEVPLYVGLSLFLIPRWGIDGAAIAVAARLSIDALLLFWAAGKYVGCALTVTSFARPLAFTLVLALALEWTRFIPVPAIMRLALGVAAALMYFLAIWIVVIDQRDKPMLLKALRFKSAPASSLT